MPQERRRAGNLDTTQESQLRLDRILQESLDSAIVMSA